METESFANEHVLFNNFMFKCIEYFTKLRNKFSYIRLLKSKNIMSYLSKDNRRQATENYYCVHTVK